MIAFSLSLIAPVCLYLSAGETCYTESDAVDNFTQKVSVANDSVQSDGCKPVSDLESKKEKIQSWKWSGVTLITLYFASKLISRRGGFK